MHGRHSEQKGWNKGKCKWINYEDDVIKKMLDPDTGTIKLRMKVSSWERNVKVKVKEEDKKKNKKKEIKVNVT